VLIERFGRRPVAEWLEVLQRSGIAAVRSTNTVAMMEDPGLRAAGIVVTTEGGALGTVEHIGVSQRLSGTPVRSGGPTPTMGQDTVAVLRELGYDDVEVGAMLGRRVVAAARL